MRKIPFSLSFALTGLGFCGVMNIINAPIYPYNSAVDEVCLAGGSSFLSRTYAAAKSGFKYQFNSWFNHFYSITNLEILSDGLSAIGIAYASLGIATKSAWAGMPPCREAIAVALSEGMRTTVTFSNENGHFYTNAKVKNATFKFLVDTGATDVTFGLQDLSTLGMNREKIKFTYKSSTANGEANVAHFYIEKLTIGDCVLTNVPASVLDHEHEPVLGMTALSHMNVHMNKGIMTLGCGE